MPLISVITAVHTKSAAYIGETAASIAAQELPGRWELEWVVQEDGDNPCLREVFEVYPFVRYAATGRQYGTAITRNLALLRAMGSVLQALDADDLLLPGAIATLLPKFVALPRTQIHWAIGQADDLLPDGTRRAYPSPIPFGLQPPGAINAWAAAHEANWPIHGAALMLRSASWRALGGWTAIPGDDELATFAALSEIATGWYDEQLTWLYRHHAGQIHRTAEAQARSAIGRQTALQRARAAAASGLQLGKVGVAESKYEVRIGPPAKDTSLPQTKASQEAS
jgi:glycosyltransferase involved in cell wall biosynthesis